MAKSFINHSLLILVHLHVNEEKDYLNRTMLATTQIKVYDKV